MTGRVVILNGTSSAGKSSLAAELQARLVERGTCWAVIGIDDALAKLPVRWVRVRDEVVGDRAEEGVSLVPTGPDTLEMRFGAVGRALLASYRGWVGATARAGIDVIADEVLLSREDHDGWRTELAGLDVTWVKVDCPISVAVEREAARGDRARGLAAFQHGLVHTWPTYDLTVDTSTLTPAGAADVVLTHLI